MVHCEFGTESTWEAFVLQCNKNKENINPLSSNNIKQPVSRRRDKPPNDDSRDDSPTRREFQQYSSVHVIKSKTINMDSSSNKKQASPTSVRTKLSSGGGSKKKKNRRQCQSAEWLDLSTDYSSSSSSANNNSSDNSIDNNIDPNELVNQLNQIYIDQLLDVSEEEKQNESLNLSIEIDDNNILYLSPHSNKRQRRIIRTILRR